MRRPHMSTRDETKATPQWGACDRCSQGVMDAGNSHTWGGCDCQCHAARTASLTGSQEP